MRSSHAQTTRITIAMLALASFFISLAPRVPATPGTPVTRPSSKTSAVPPASEAATKMKVKENYGKLPLSFEPNRGQADPQVKFLSRGSGYKLFLTATEAVLSLRNEKAVDSSPASDNPQSAIQNLKSAVLRMKLVEANPQSRIEGESQQQGKSNYLIGNDQRKWHAGIPNFAQVRYTSVYPGIDLIYYGTNQRQLEYDFIVSPGGDPKVIKVAFEGADQFSLDREGNLVLETGYGNIIQRAPVVYQEVGGVRQRVVGRYILISERELSFEIGAYDHSQPLVIDPQIIYSTFFGGTGNDIGRGIAVDHNGNVYLTGATSSVDLEIKSAFQTLLNNGNSDNNADPLQTDAFVTKLNPSGTTIIYSTYVGSSGTDGHGTSVAQDVSNAIALMSDGKACITGRVSNDGTSNFPTTSNRFQGNGSAFGQLEGADAFVTVLTADGSNLFYSTFLGGSQQGFIYANGGTDEGLGIAVDSSNKLYVTGSTSSNNFPTKNAFQNSRASTDLTGDDAFIAKFDPAAGGGLFDSTLLYSSFLGGAGTDIGRGIAVTSNGIVFIVGETGSFNFPVKSSSSLPPFQRSQGGVADAFVAKFNLNLSGSASLTYSTFFGGNDADRALAVAVDPSERAYVTGFTQSSAATFPLKNAFDSTQSSGEAFVAKFNADGTTLFYSSFLGDSALDEARGIAIDSAGSAYVTGKTNSSNFPTVNGFAESIPSGNTFVTKIEASDATGTTTPNILYSDTFGGFGTEGRSIAIDSKGNVYVTGQTTGNLLATPGALQESFHPGTCTSGTCTNDAFVVKIDPTFNDTIGVFRPSTGQFLLRNSNTAGSPDITITFGQSGDQPLAGDWDGDGKDDVGVFRNGQFLLRKPSVRIVNGIPTVVFITVTITFGQAGDLAVVGDWNGDGIDTPGVFRPAAAGTFFLTNTIANNSTAPADIVFNFGTIGDLPVAGDWNGDGIETPGIFRPSAAGAFFLENNFVNFAADIFFNFGTNGDLPLAGDWTGAGIDRVGVFRPSTNTMFLANNFANSGDTVFAFGQAGDLPIAGDWDGKPPADNPPNSGVNDPGSGSSRVEQGQTFTTTCSDPDGWHDISTIDFKVVKSDGNGDGVPIALWVQFDENRNLIRFYDPDLQTWSEGAPGSNITLESRFAKLYLAQTSAHGSGPTGPSVQITWTVVFKDAAVMNNYKQYLMITDDSGLSTGFDKVGSWSVRP